MANKEYSPDEVRIGARLVQGLIGTVLLIACGVAIVSKNLQALTILLVTFAAGRWFGKAEGMRVVADMVEEVEVLGKLQGIEGMKDPLERKL